MGRKRKMCIRDSLYGDSVQYHQSVERLCKGRIQHSKGSGIHGTVSYTHLALLLLGLCGIFPTLRLTFRRVAFGFLRLCGTCLLYTSKLKSRSSKAIRGGSASFRACLLYTSNEDGSIRPISKWSGVNFTEQQKADYVAGKAVKLENVTDKDVYKRQVSIIWVT